MHNRDECGSESNGRSPLVGKLGESPVPPVVGKNSRNTLQILSSASQGFAGPLNGLKIFRFFETIA
jgi:hypothetical protein